AACERAPAPDAAFCSWMARYPIRPRAVDRPARSLRNTGLVTARIPATSIDGPGRSGPTASQRRPFGNIRALHQLTGTAPRDQILALRSTWIGSARTSFNLLYPVDLAGAAVGSVLFVRLLAPLGAPRFTGGPEAWSRDGSA